MKLRMTEADYDRLNPPILDHIMDEETGKPFEEIILDERWLHVGYIPTPTTRIGWFVYHLIHGLAMRYPPLAVLVYAWRNSTKKGCECSISSN